MKNITVSVDDDLYRRARIWAAHAGSNVSALVRHVLSRLTEKDPSFGQLATRQQAVIARFRSEYPGFAAGERLSRDAVHERDALR